MACMSILHLFKVAVSVTIFLGGLAILFSMYHNSSPSRICYTPPAFAVGQQTVKPLVLLWFWPENKKFDLQDCKTFFNIDTCKLTDDRSLYSSAQAVLLFHNAIQDDLSNLPTSTRARSQRWIWFNMDSPKNTSRIAGIEGLFNLTLSYRKDADIYIHWKLTLKKKTDEDFVLPKKERLLCWIVDKDDLITSSEERYNYYRELIKHIKVDVFHSSSDLLKAENYFKTIGSCKFYLSFEGSSARDYITETFNGPLAAGTVPVVLGPSRKNYEDFAPGSSFIHVNDFSDASKLAEFLLKLDKDNEGYMTYFNWRETHTARRHLTEERHKFAHAICQACHHVGLKNRYRAIPNVYKWLSA